MTEVTTDADARLAGLDPGRLRGLDDFLRQLTERGRIPGWSVAVSRRSVLAHASTGGYRDMEAGLPVEAGTILNYSVATDVLGRVVEVVSGQTLGEFCAERIFGPLGMRDTAFTVPAADRGRLAQLYTVTQDGGLTLAPALAATVTRPGRGHFGGGGLASTTGDYLRFAAMLGNRGALGGVRILGRPTVDFMVRNHLPAGADLLSFGRPMNAESPLSGVGQGLGVSVLLDPALAGYPGSPGEFGWGGAASTVFWVNSALDLVMVFMTQALPAAALPIRGKLHELVMQALA